MRPIHAFRLIAGYLLVGHVVSVILQAVGLSWIAYQVVYGLLAVALIVGAIVMARSSAMPRTGSTLLYVLAGAEAVILVLRLLSSSVNASVVGSALSLIGLVVTAVTGVWVGFAATQDKQLRTIIVVAFVSYFLSGLPWLYARGGGWGYLALGIVQFVCLWVALAAVGRSQVGYSREREYHPWLKAFTVFAVVGGVLFAAMGALMGSDPYNTGALPAGFALFGAVMMAAACQSLWVTEGLRHWDAGISGLDKAVGTFAMIMGGCFSIALFFTLPAFLRGVREDNA